MNNIWLHRLGGLLMCCAAGALPAHADIFSQCPPDTDGVDTDGDGIVDNDHFCFHTTSGDGMVVMADGTSLYNFGFHDATGIPDSEVMAEGLMAAEFCSPTIVLKEGQKAYISLSNVGMAVRPDLFDPHTIHYHGYDQAANIFDGVPEVSLSINMGATLTYYYNIWAPGTYAWHCHVEATEHMEMGMMGNLYVLPIQNNTASAGDFAASAGGSHPHPEGHEAGDKYVYNDGDGSTYYDVEYPIMQNTFDWDFHNASFTVQPLSFVGLDTEYPMLNGRGYPDTVNTNALLNRADEEGFEAKYSQKVHSLITATQGQRVLLRFVGMSVDKHNTITIPDIPMLIVGGDGRHLRGPDGKNLYYTTHSVTISGGVTKEAILDTTNVAPGTYFLYTANLNHLSNMDEDYGGMMTEIRISAAPVPLLPAPTPRSDPRPTDRETPAAEEVEPVEAGRAAVSASALES